MRIHTLAALSALLAGARADLWCSQHNCSGKLPQLLLNRTLLPKTAQTVILNVGTYEWDTSTQMGNFYNTSKHESPPPGWEPSMGAVIAGDRGSAHQDPDPNSWAVTIQGKQKHGRDECKDTSDIGTYINAHDLNGMFYLFGGQTLNLQCVVLTNGRGPLSGGVLMNCTQGCKLHLTHAEFQHMKFTQTNKSYENLTASVINIIDGQSSVTDANVLYHEDVLNASNMKPICSNHKADKYEGLYCDQPPPVRPKPKNDDDDGDDDADDDANGGHHVHHHDHKTPAALIGGVVGAVVLLGLLAGLVLYRRRRMRDHFGAAGAGGGGGAAGGKAGAGAPAMATEPVAVVVASTTVKGGDTLGEPLLQTQNQAASAGGGGGGGGGGGAAGEPASGWY